MSGGGGAQKFDEVGGAKVRQFQMMTVLGAPGSGKTSLLEEIFARYAAKHPGTPITVVDPNAQFGPPLGVWPDDGDMTAWLTRFKAERKKRGNPPGMLAIDDIDKMLSGGPPTGIWRDLFTSFRHWGLDLILNARRSQDVPKVAIASSSTLALFIHRELYGRQYLRANLGAEIVDKLPTKPHQYLLVDVDANTATLHGTKKRAAVVGADARRT